MSFVDFLKSVGGVTLPDEVIQQAKQNQEEDRKKRQEQASEQKQSKNQ